MAQIKTTPYTKTGDVLTFKFRVTGFSQDAINALVLELLVQLEGSDDHPTAYLVEPATDDAQLFAEREAFVAEQDDDEVCNDCDRPYGRERIDDDCASCSQWARENSEIAPVSDAEANEQLVAALAALPAYNGWRAHWEYPGYVAFHRKGSPSVFATPDYHERGQISCEVEYSSGHQRPLDNAPWPRRGRTPEAYMAIMRPVLDKAAPLSDTSDDIFEDVMRAMQQAEEMGGPEGAQYVALLERIAHEAQRRANTMRDTLAGTDEEVRS